MPPKKPKAEYHYFPRGDPCTFPNCRSSQYFEDNGKRYCRKYGHEQEGYISVQADEDDFNTQGRKTRLKRPEAIRVAPVWTGEKALSLFLQCYQLILRKQVSWLVNVKGYPVELETVVRDLWNVKLRGVKSLRDDSRKAAYSSAMETDTEAERSGKDGRIQLAKRKRKLTNQSGTPKLIETLCLCYLGCILMRLPVSLGDFHRWAETDEILYLRVVSF